MSLLELILSQLSEDLEVEGLIQLIPQVFTEYPLLALHWRGFFKTKKKKKKTNPYFP